MKDSSQILNRAIQKLHTSIFTVGADKSPSIVKDVGYDWEPFGAIPGDKAKRIDCENKEIYALLYFAPEGSRFPKHFHTNRETGLILQGNIRLKTPSKSLIIKETETYILEAEEWHSVEFLSDTLLIIQFHPPFRNGWESTIETDMEKNLNPNFKTRKKPVNGIIIHSMAEIVGGVPAAQFLADYGLSAHYLIRPDGEIVETVPTEKVAYHAGVSNWLGQEHLNSSYIGIELLVPGDHSYGSFVEAIKSSDNFSREQFEACVDLCKSLVKKYPDILAKRVVRHSDVSGDSVRGDGKGKVDPGRGFNFEELKKEIFEL